MTPDYAALAQRLRVMETHILVQMFDGQRDNLLAAASALDRLAAVEGALRDAIRERDADNDWLRSRGEPAREDTPALATARRALEGGTHE